MPPRNEPLETDFGRRLLRFGSATLGESGAVAAMPSLRAMWRGAAVAGPAFTVECAPGDNLAVHVGVASAAAGSVLAVSVPGDIRRGYWGEVLTVAAMAAGATGLVIDATVRDIEAIERRRFPVFARGTAIPGAGKQGPGSVGKSVVIGDAVVRPGDWLVGDADGVVVVRRENVEACLQAAAQRAEKESAMFQRLQAGSTTVALLGLDVTSIEVSGAVDDVREVLAP
jgi:4-hydroxy-4-methyl-2-oxoglutarate aldolase